MPRPMKGRKVCCLPQNARFGPLGCKGVQLEEIIMTVDEYETIRLIDYLDFTQEECSQQMKVARTTVQGIYSQARKKLSHPGCMSSGTARRLLSARCEGSFGVCSRSIQYFLDPSGYCPPPDPVRLL